MKTEARVDELEDATAALAEELHGQRSLCIFLDGTSNEFNASESNVLRLYQLIEKDKQQLAYYQTGIGTISESSAFVAPTTLEAKLSMALGTSVDYHVQLAYTWLCDNYRGPSEDKTGNKYLGDRIYIYGFSRGAYAARVLASMILTIGILDAGCTTLIPKAYAAYSCEFLDKKTPLSGMNTYVPAANTEDAKRFRRSAVKVKEIHFLGLWDTVQSVHHSSTPQLPGTDSLYGVTHIAHAVALDEQRYLFPVLKVAPTSSDEINHETGLKSGAWGLALKPHLHEMCFAGVHADVGGGEHVKGAKVDLFDTFFFKKLVYTPNPAYIPLRWMMYQAGMHGTRFSWENTHGGFRDEERPWLVEVPAPCLLHLLPLLRELRAGGMPFEKRVEFAFEAGALFDSLSKEMLVKLAQSGASHGIKKAAQGVLADLSCPLKLPPTYLETKKWAAMGLDWRQFNPFSTAEPSGIRNFTVDVGPMRTDPKREIRIHPSVVARSEVWAKKPLAEQYVPKAHLFDSDNVKLTNIGKLLPVTYQALKGGSDTSTPDERMAKLLESLVEQLGSEGYTEGWDTEAYSEE